MDMLESQRLDAATLLKLAESTGSLWQVTFPDGKLSHSGELKRRLGYEDGTLADTVEAWMSITHPDDREALCEAWLGHLKRRAPYDIDYRARTRWGEYRWFNSRGQAVWDETGRATMMAGVIYDITSHREAEARAEAGHDRFRKVFHLSPVPTALTVLDDARILDVNEAFHTFFGYAREELLGRTSIEVGIHADLAARARIVERLRAEGKVRDSELAVRMRSGETRTVAVSADAVDFDGDACVLVTFRDVTDRKRYEERIEYLATHDELTGLPNRTLMRDRISQALARARREGTQIAVMFLDLDRFKVVNDGYGHPFGDALLRAFGDRLKELVREGDTVARLGGDEFLILLPHLRRSGDAYVVAQKILDSFDGGVTVDEREIFVGTSIGVSLFPQDGTDVDALVTHADVAMYRSKAMGGGVYQFFNSEMSRETMRRVELETHLRTALAHRALEVRYQPKVEIASGRITGCEALLRWNHVSMGSVPPAQFIPVAEESGLIVPIGDWVLRTACAHNRIWQAAGFGPTSVAVNLSARQFLRQDVVSWVLAALEDTGLDPSLLELELTESLIAEDPDKVAATIRELKAHGVKFSIDDFGTGYSSLSYLRRFAVDSLKIDQSFVKNVGSVAGDEAISLAVISLAHSLGLKVIAEGVETAQQRDFLLRHGCDEIQGFLYGGALTTSEFAGALGNGPFV
jgi:diguanylate cyclase (GGDEF)-like protein/PAS domain S-box-containing protein